MTLCLPRLTRQVSVSLRPGCSGSAPTAGTRATQEAPSSLCLFTETPSRVSQRPLGLVMDAGLAFLQELLQSRQVPRGGRWPHPAHLLCLFLLLGSPADVCAIWLVHIVPW